MKPGTKCVYKHIKGIPVTNSKTAIIPNSNEVLTIIKEYIRPSGTISFIVDKYPKQSFLKEVLIPIDDILNSEISELMNEVDEKQFQINTASLKAV